MDVLGYLPNASQVIAFTGVTAQSTAGSQTNSLLVRLVSDADCFVAFGVNPVANTTTSVFLPAGSPEYFKFEGSWKVAVIQKTGAGNLYMTEMSR